ncbi:MULTISPECIES: helix-turn-helix transcriptional regulator [Enorma]|uniref:helix-turn-helix transcriptional regulator n=1 Tax=Enorma TaxID=1472762 RepID=UPI00034988DF|nr:MULTISPECIES: helix-turn-helix transcriptional regulator [Enorma]
MSGYLTASTIKSLREHRGLTQRALADAVGVTDKAVSKWETSKTLPDVQSMLLLANLFGTTIDELVKGDVDEMREMVKQDERRTKTFAVALAAVEIAVVAVLAITAVVGRAYLELALRLLLAVLVLASSLVAVAARRGGDGRDARSVAELFGAATGEPAETAHASGAALGMRLVLQVFAGLVTGIGVLVLGGLLLDQRAFIGLAVVVGAVAVLAVSYALGRFARPAWTAAILPLLWVAGATAVGIATGAFASPRGWFAVVGGAVTLLILWLAGRKRREGIR